jgi:phosphatidate cytidylyltransferase
MLIRIIASLTLVPLGLFVFYGGVPLYLAQIAMSSTAIYEFYNAFKEKNINPLYSIGYIFSIFIGLKNIMHLPTKYTFMVLFVLFIMCMISMLRVKNNIIDVSITLLGLVYVDLFLDFIILTINDFTLGYIYVWFIFIIACATDTFAYFSGYLFGKHKLIPKVSPKKTIEGSIGGMLGSIICCTIFGYIFNLNLGYIILLGAIGSIVAQIGDLFASSIKRFVGIKDYGKLIPGHGGILDRFDSVILVSPFVYYAFYLLV